MSLKANHSLDGERGAAAIHPIALTCFFVGPEEVLPGQLHIDKEYPLL